MNQKYGYILNPVYAFLMALFISGVVISLFGENPFKVYWVFFESSLFSARGISYTLFYATPLIYSALAVAIAFHCGLFNIGVEGQLYIGSISATIVALEFQSLPGFLLLPLTVLTAFMAGGIWGAIPGFLKAKLGAHEVINTIMMNMIGMALANYLVLVPYKRKNTMLLDTDIIPDKAVIPQFLEISPIFSDFSQLNLSFVLAIFCCLVFYWLIWKTKTGYELRATGSGVKAANYAGINSAKMIILAMFIAGGFAGLVATHEVLGFRRYYHDNFSGGVGFIGIAVALMGRNHPVGIIICAILFGALMRGGLFMNINFDRISSDVVILLQGILILCVSSESLYTKAGKFFKGLTSKEKKL